MERFEIAPGAFLTVVPGEKFKRGKIAVNLIVPSRREDATALALMPHVLDRRCEAVPDPTALSRYLFSLYGADLSGESFIAGANRVVSFGVSGLKNEYALAGEDLAGKYLDLLCGVVFAPVREAGVFVAEDVEIEKEKQADFLRSEMNDKRGYCLRQARRKLYGTSPLGIEPPGYLEDIPQVRPDSLYAGYQSLLERAQVEVLVCGADAQRVAEVLAGHLAAVNRAPVGTTPSEPIAARAQCEHYSEAMDTVQGKLCIIGAGGGRPDARGEAVMRVASAIFGGLPTSRLFMNVREKQSLCYYCASSYGYYSGTLTVDSGVDHDKAPRAAEAILKELEALQKTPVEPAELDAAKRYLRSVFSSGKDSPDVLMNWAFNEWLRGTSRTLDEALALTESVQAEEVREAMARFVPSVEYVITGKEGGQ